MYVSGAATWTVKVASVSFYKSGGPPGGGVFVVMNAVTGQPCGIFQENRFMTDLRTGASAASPRAVDACDIVDQRRRRGRHRAQALWQGRHDRLHRLRRHRPRHGPRRQGGAAGLQGRLLRARRLARDLRRGDVRGARRAVHGVRARAEINRWSARNAGLPIWFAGRTRPRRCAPNRTSSTRRRPGARRA